MHWLNDFNEKPREYANWKAQVPKLISKYVFILTQQHKTKKCRSKHIKETNSWFIQHPKKIFRPHPDLTNKNFTSSLIAANKPCLSFFRETMGPHTSVQKRRRHKTLCCTISDFHFRVEKRRKGGKKQLRKEVHVQRASPVGDDYLCPSWL